MANAKVWDKVSVPKDGESINLDLVVKRQIAKYKDADGVEHDSIFLVNVGEGSGKFRHGVTIATLPDGQRVTLRCEIKLMPVKQVATTISSSQFSIK